MSVDELHKDIGSYRAEEAIGANLFVKQGAAQNGLLLAGAGEAVVGVTGVGPIADTEIGPVVEDGDVAVFSGAAVTINDIVTPDGDGKAVTTTQGDVEAGQAKTAATDADELIVVRLLRGGNITA